MTEEEYINTQAYTNIRTAKNAMRDIISESKIDKDKQQKVKILLSELYESHYKAIKIE